MHLELPAIECDLSNDLDREFVEWYSTDKSRTKQIVLLGYCTLVHGAGAYYAANCDSKQTIDGLQVQLRCLEREKNRLRESIDDAVADGVRVATAVHERAKARWDAERERMDADNARLVSALESRLNASAADARAAVELKFAHAAEADGLRHAAEIAMLRADLTHQCDRYRALYEEVKTRLDGYTDGMYKRQIDELQTSLENQRKMVDMLSKTNSGKGTLGENMLADYFRSHFTDWSVVDKSGCKHCGDLWVHRADGRILIVESKYKEIVTRADVEKFSSDADYVVSTQGSEVLGGLFVSLRSRNIPGKGDMCIEFRNFRPFMYVGLRDEHELDGPFVKQCASLIAAIGDFHMNTERRDADVTKTLEKIHPLIRNVETLRRSLDNIKAAHKSVVDNVSTMQDNIASIFTVIHEVLVSNGINTCSTPTKKAAPKTRRTRGPAKEKPVAEGVT